MVSKGYSVKIGKICIKRNLSISCAESLSGGLLSHLITNTPGSSKYFKGSIICYSDWIKNKKLNVPLSILKEKGSVSEEVAKILAKNIRKKFHTDIGLAVVGVAGPSRDIKENPIGRVFIGINIKNKTYIYKFRFRGTRIAIKEKAGYKTLSLLLSALRGWKR